MRSARFQSLAEGVLLLGALAAGSNAWPGETSDPAEEVARFAQASEVLVFADGDRTRGHLIGRDGDFLIFQSVRFGELRVPADSASIEPAIPIATMPEPVTPESVTAEASPPPASPPPAGFPTKAQPAEAVQETRVRWTSPAALSESLLRFLGPWKGRFAVAFSLTSDTSKGENLGADLTFSRKWANDEAKFASHYYRSSTNEVVDTDLLKANGLLRHDFKGPIFVSYRPSLEWNRAHTIGGAEADYVLLQEAIGIGVNLLDVKGQTIGLGIAENVFNLWTLVEDTHSTRDTQSLFAEVEFSLPWRITLHGRGTWYYSLATGDQGWEEYIELNKKFSDALSLGVRRESRHNNPDSRIADYSFLQLQMGFDF